MDFENVLLVKNQVFVYPVPPRQSNRGYRAGDLRLDSPIWTGRMRLVSIGNDAVLRLEDRNTGELFAKCPIDAFPGIAVECVLDSSRYFVIRLMADDGRTSFVVVGFAERSDSFDLKVAIQDHFKLLKREQEDEAKKNDGPQPSLNLSFKEGQRIKLNLNTRRTNAEDSSGTGINKPKVALTAGGGKASFGLLPPPPAPSMSRVRGNRNLEPTPYSRETSLKSGAPEVDQLFTLD